MVEWRKILNFAVGVFSILTAFFFGEVPLVALVGLSLSVSAKCGLGFIGAYFFFSVTMASLGFFCFCGYRAGVSLLVRLFGGSGGDFRTRFVKSISARLGGWLSFLLVAVLLGPVFGIPFFDNMGLRGKRGLCLVTLSSIPFSLAWVSVYGVILKEVV